MFFFFSNSFAFFIRGLVLKLTEWFSLIVPQSRPTLCDPMDCSTPGFPVHHQLSELTQTHVLWVGDAPSNHLIVCHPLHLFPSIFPSIRVFSSESVLHIRWPKYWSFSISTFIEYLGLISFRIDWLDLLAVQRTLKSPPTPQSKSHQSFGAQLSLWSNSHIHTWLLEKPWLDLCR